MKEVIYKLTFNNYKTIFHKDHNNIDKWEEKWHPKGGIFSNSNHSDDEKEYEKNYGNPLCTVRKSGSMIVVEKDEKKLSLKLFMHHRFRKAGVTWFRVIKDMKFISVNLETGDFYEGGLENYHLKKKCKKRFTKNYFKTRPISNFFHTIKSNLGDEPNHTEKISETFKIFFQTLDGDISSNEYTEERLLKFYLTKKKIKFPNNYNIFYWNNQGLHTSLKDLRKSEMKLVETHMKINGLKGDVIKKILHGLPSITTIYPSNLKNTLGLFPNSWILQDELLVLKLLTSPHTTSMNWTEQIESAKQIMSNKELKNLFACFKDSVMDGHFSAYSIMDHLEFYNYLNRVGEKIKWKSNNWMIFKDEHLDWADKYEHYKRGYYTRIYPDSLDYSFKIPFISGEDVYYPVILKTSDEYNEESQTQSNCVKGYIGRPSSIIISIRKNSIVSSERATVEYQIFKEDGVVKFNRPQSLGTYNSRLSEIWTPILKESDTRMKSWLNSSENFVTVKIEKELKNLDRKLFSDSDWSENGFLFWTYNLINKSSSYMPDIFQNALQF